MCLIEIPQLLFYIHIPALVVSLLLASFILFSDYKKNTNRMLFIFIIFLSLWINNNMFGWIIQDVQKGLLLTKSSIIINFASYFFLLFIFAFTSEKVSQIKKIYYSLPFIPLLIFINSDYNATIFEEKTCTYQYGFLLTYGYLLSLIYLIYSIKKLFSFYRKQTDILIKKQAKIIMYAFVFIILWLLFFTSVGNTQYAKIVLNDQLYEFVPIGIVFFIGILTYAITKYQLLKMKLISSYVLTYSIWILIGSQYFFADSLIVKLLISLTLFLSFLFGLILIRSVGEEVKRKEELQMMADKLAVANEELKKLDNAKSEFISIASHQLRTPLTAIKGFVSLVLEGSYGEINPRVRDALTKVYSSGERLIHLVEDLLNVSRIESGRMEFKMEKTKVEDILHELYDTFVLVAKDRKLSLELKLPKRALTQVNVDAAKIREVLSNLIDNALKYTERGGVTVKAEMAISEGRTNGAKESAIASQAKVNLKGKKVLRVTVSDTGIGIPESEMPYMFGKFSRGKDTSRLHVGGTGLGLYVGKSIVEAHGGHIWAESDGAGRGSRFVVEIPLPNKK